MEAPSFEQAVWQIVGAVPAGRVCSYGRVAELAGYPRHARHVGRTLSRLPPGSKLPWHRIVRADGQLPMGEEQAERLRAEGVPVLGGRVSVARLGWP